MRIFFTGGTGKVGSAIIRSLLSGPDSRDVIIRALARSEAGVASIKELGAEPVHGDISDLELLASESSHADMVIYCAFDHSRPTGFVDQANIEATAIGVVCKALSTTSSTSPGEGGKKVLMYCTGVMGFPKTSLATEQTPLPGSYRGATHDTVTSYATNPPEGEGIRAVQIRLGGVVHSNTRIHTFLRMMIHDDHISYYADGSNTWPAANCADVGDLVASVVHKRAELPDGITAIHAYSEQVSQKDAAEAIAKKLGLTVRSFGDDEAKKMSPMARLISTNTPNVSNEWTIKTYGWKPKGESVVQEIANADAKSAYFA